MEKETRTPIVKFILNKGELGNIWAALKVIVTEGHSAGPKDDVILMKVMEIVGPMYDELNEGDVRELTLDPDTAHYCWQALSFVMQNALAPESQQTKLISLVQHMGFALECLNNIEPKDD